MDSPYKKVILVECGASMENYDGKLFGNTCFFNSLKAGLVQLDSSLESMKYSDFLALGGWNKGFQGNMVDTFVHALQIEQLARCLGYKISVFTEILPGITNSTIYSPFGIEGPEIRIIRLRGFAHFNLMLWHTDQKMIESDRKLAEEIEKKQREEDAEKIKQIREDLAIAKKEQEKYIQITKIRQEAENNKKMKQIQDDHDLAKLLECI